MVVISSSVVVAIAPDGHMYRFLAQATLGSVAMASLAAVVLPVIFVGCLVLRQEQTWRESVRVILLGVMVNLPGVVMTLIAFVVVLMNAKIVQSGTA